MDSTLNFLFFFLAGSVLRRFKGGGICGTYWVYDIHGLPALEVDKIPALRRYGSPLIYGLLNMLNWNDPLVQFALIFGFFAIDWVGTGDMFAVFHGWFDGIIKYSHANRWIYFLAEKLAGGAPIAGGGYEPELKSARARHNAKWGFWVATLRGTYRFAFSVPLAVITGNPFAVLWGALGWLDGIIYFTAGRIAYRFMVLMERPSLRKFIEKSGLNSSVVLAEQTSGGVIGIIVLGCKP